MTHERSWTKCGFERLSRWENALVSRTPPVSVLVDAALNRALIDSPSREVTSQSKGAGSPFRRRLDDDNAADLPRTG